MFYQNWFDQGVYSICDILDSSGMYLNFADFCLKFSVKSSFLTYFQILSAIPKRLLEKARDSFGANPIFTPVNSTFHLSSSLSVDLSKFKCKDYYWLFLNRKETYATGPSKWQRDLPQFTLSWSTIFNRIKSISKQNKLKNFFTNSFIALSSQRKNYIYTELKKTRVVITAGMTTLYSTPS